jgi:aspartate/methionine/tyrosine aminotransferase
VSGPDELKESAAARLEVIADTFLSMNAPVQVALPTLLAQGSAFQRQVRQRTQTNLEELDRQLAARDDCSRLKLDGGWYAVVRLPTNALGEVLALALLNEQGIHVHPGHYYDFAPDRFLVLSLLTPVSDFSRGVAGIVRGLTVS